MYTIYTTYNQLNSHKTLILVEESRFHQPNANYARQTAAHRRLRCRRRHRQTSSALSSSSQQRRHMRAMMWPSVVCLVSVCVCVCTTHIDSQPLHASTERARDTVYQFPVLLAVHAVENSLRIIQRINTSTMRHDARAFVKRTTRTHCLFLDRSPGDPAMMFTWRILRKTVQTMYELNNMLYTTYITSLRGACDYTSIIHYARW